MENISFNALYELCPLAFACFLSFFFLVGSVSNFFIKKTLKASKWAWKLRAPLTKIYIVSKTKHQLQFINVFFLSSTYPVYCVGLWFNCKLGKTSPSYRNIKGLGYLLSILSYFSLQTHIFCLQCACFDREKKIWWGRSLLSSGCWLPPFYLQCGSSPVSTTCRCSGRPPVSMEGTCCRKTICTGRWCNRLASINTFTQAVGTRLPPMKMRL